MSKFRRYILSFFLSIISVQICAQVNDTVFIKKDTHQKIYIEKNKSSDYYKFISDFQDFKSVVLKKKVNQLLLDSYWIKINNYKGQYFLYVPCDWMYDTKIVIDDKKIQVRNSEIIDFNIKFIRKVNDEIIIKCKNPNNKKLVLKIHPIDKNLGIYEFTFQDGSKKYKYLMVNKKNYLNFNIIVNECIDSKRKEFDFD